MYSPFASARSFNPIVTLLLGAVCLSLVACDGASSDSTQAASARNQLAARQVTSASVSDVSFTPLSWPNPQPDTRYTLPDGTLVTHIGGRVRSRHAREQGTNDQGGIYAIFPVDYFEHRTHDITIYDNAVPGSADERVLTIVVRPQSYLHSTNFRHGYIGRTATDPLQPTRVALYADNGGMKILPGGLIDKTPLANYNALASDPNTNYTPPSYGVPGNDFVLVKEINTKANENHRPLKSGDLVEFELGIFLAGDKTLLGQTAYYSDALVYKAGSTGVYAWYRGPEYNVVRPWDSTIMPDIALSGGSMTVQEDTSNQPDKMLQQAGTNIAGDNIQPWMEGRRLFHTSFATGAHTEPGNKPFPEQMGKIGPLFAADACAQCHFADGKSSPALGSPLSKLGVFVGATDSHGQQVDDARFGSRIFQGMLKAGANQVFDGRDAILTLAPYIQVTGTYPDGTPYTLQKPSYALTDKAGNTLPLPGRMSVRAAPQLVGMGLLEAVPETQLQTLVANGTVDVDGAGGKLQIVPDPVNPQINRVGRFGWRAGAPTVAFQVALALNSDIGVTSNLLPKHVCSAGSAGAACVAADAKGVQLSDADLGRLTTYLSLLGVPARRHFPAPELTDPAQQLAQTRVANGAQLFDQMRCVACHVGQLQTGAHNFAELRSQTIRPYTDLLLHDMGPNLADSFTEGVAGPSEWRTAPLWGIGYVAKIDPNVRYLHDGRARTLEEAILWHGGQATNARNRFMNLSADMRQQVLEFLQSL
ncbi:MAG: c-type cytochrome [Burkholderiales bacterium]|nr:c-type cytochrome [Burkholderiales bacterium]